MNVNKIGTIRKETHQGGYTIWLLTMFGPGQPLMWFALYSTLPGNQGYRLIELADEAGQRIAGYELVHYVEGTPARQTIDALIHAHYGFIDNRGASGG